MNLQTAFEQQFPELISQAVIETDENQIIVTLQFSNPRNKAWIAGNDLGYMVGINEFHNPKLVCV